MKKLFYKICIIFFIIIITIPNFSFCDDMDNETIDVNAEILSSTTSQSEIKAPETNSRSCVIIDRNTNTVLYGKKENEKRKMASTTKIMTSTIIIENCNLDEIIEISKKAAGTSGSRLGLKSGDKISVRDLLYGLMLRSGNDAAVALAEYAGGNISDFAELMNKKATSLGLKNTHFETPHGLDSDEHYTTAYELAILTNYALHNKTFTQIVGTKNYNITINGYSKSLSNTNELLGNLDGVYGVKTGFTNGANRCLVTSCKRNDLDIICVVLGADTKKFRTSDSLKLINYVFENFATVNLQDLINKDFENWKKENLDTFTISKGIFEQIDLKLENLESPCLPIRKDLINNITLSINCKTFLDAPIYKDTEIGNIQILSNNQSIANCKIINNLDINKKSPYYYFKFFIKNLSYIFQNNLL